MSNGRHRSRRLLSGFIAVAMLSGLMPVGSVSAVSPPAQPVSRLVAQRPTAAASVQSLRYSGRSRRFVAPEALNVRWRPGVTSTQVLSASRRLGFTPSRTLKTGWAELKPKAGTSAGALARALRRAGLATQATPQLWVTAADAPVNDPLFGSQWPLENTGQDGGTKGNDIDAVAAWAQVTGSRDVVVAVVDEGVNWAHPDLKNNLWFNEKEIPGNKVDDDRNGYVDDVRGWDFANGDNTVYDAADGDRHGTHVAGIIGAEGNNGIGITGVTQRVRIMPVKFLGPMGGSDYAGAQAIMYAVDHGATAINCSWVGYGESPVLNDAVKYAASKGVVLVCAAGNDGWNNDDPQGGALPASIEATNVISVAATDRNDKLAWWSNFGEDSVDLAAPGVDVTSTLPASLSGFYIDRFTSSALFLPLQVEVAEPAGARDALIAGVVRQFGEPTSTPVLVVDDSASKITSETPGTRLAVYTKALAAAGYPDVSTWVTEEKGTPSQQAMLGKIVVWFTGAHTFNFYDDFCLNYQEQLAIQACLDGGGRVALLSGNAANDLQGWGQWIPELFPTTLDLLGQYFGVKFIDDLTWSGAFEGRTSSALAGLNVTVPKRYLEGIEEDTRPYWGTGSDTVTRKDTGYASTTIMGTGAYATLSGTSMAAPHVTGAFALLKAKYAGTPADEIVARILNTTDSVPGLGGRTATGGRLNVAAAMSAYPGRVTITSPKKGETLHAGAPGKLTWRPAVAGAPAATFSAQVGIPYAAYSEGFESGNLGAFRPNKLSGSAWTVTSESRGVYSGAFAAVSGILPAAVPAPEIGEGWYTMGMSAMETTISVPEGGGDLTFRWRMPESGYDQMGFFYSDEMGDFLDPWMGEDPQAWQTKTIRFTAGDHLIGFQALNGALVSSDVRLYVDDISLTAHRFASIGEAGPGATSMDFTVPTAATDDAWFRIQSHLNGVNSSWATVKGVRITNDSVVPAPPASLELRSADGSVSITWSNTDASDFDRTLVLASTTRMPLGRDDASATVAYEGTGTAAPFGPVKHGEKVYVSAWSSDKSGNWSEPKTAEITGVDVTPPDPPRSIRALQLAPGVPLLSWSAGAGGVVHPSVLRRYDATPTVDDPDAMPVDGAMGGAVTDWDVDPDAAQAFYTVYLTDESGNVSAPVSVRAVLDANGVTGTLRVESEKQEPMSSAAIVETSTVWVNADVTNATEMRVSINDEADPNADWVPFLPRFQVELLPVHGAQTVNVEFRRGIAEQPSVLSATALVMLRSPLAATGVKAETWNTGVRLTWDTPATGEGGGGPGPGGEPGPGGGEMPPGGGGSPGAMPLTGDPTLQGWRVYQAASASGPWKLVGTPGTVEMSGSSFYSAKLKAGATYFYKLVGLDVLGRKGPESCVVTATAGAGVRRIGGDSRAKIAAAASAAQFAARSAENTVASDYVVIAPDSDYVQALAANSLAGRYRASVLLAGKTLPSATAAEAKRLGVHRAFVVGTGAAVSTSVDRALKDLGLRVERIGGNDRFEVAAKVARRMSTTGMALKDAFVVNGGSYADVITLMPLAYASGRPVLPVNKTSVPPAVSALIAKTKFSSVTVIGGQASVSDEALGVFSPEVSQERIAGKNGYDTAVRAATWATEQGIASWSRVSIASPTSWAGLTIGSASAGGVVLLTPGTSLDKLTSAALKANAPNIGMASVFGATSTISSAVQSKILAAVTIPQSQVIAAPMP